MFIALNDLKGLILDLSSFKEASYPDILELNNQFKLLLFDTDKTKLNMFRNKGLLTHFGQLFGYYNIDLEEIVNCLNLLGLNTYDVALVSQNYSTIKDAFKIPIGTILIKDNPTVNFERGYLPDFTLTSLKEIIDIRPGKNELTGYLSEIIALVKGSRNKIGIKNNNVYIERSKDYIESEEINIVTGGRYFAKGDFRHGCHQLSHRILRHKNNRYSQDNIFTVIYDNLLNYIDCKIQKVDGIASVPPRPCDDYDRFSNIIKAVCSKKSYKNYCTNLMCKKLSKTNNNESRRKKRKCPRCI